MELQIDDGSLTGPASYTALSYSSESMIENPFTQNVVSSKEFGTDNSKNMFCIQMDIIIKKIHIGAPNSTDRFREQLQDLHFNHIRTSYKHSCLHLTESFQQVEKVKLFKNNTSST